MLWGGIKDNSSKAIHKVTGNSANGNMDAKRIINKLEMTLNLFFVTSGANVLPIPCQSVIGSSAQIVYIISFNLTSLILYPLF